jgi:CRP-like cAMP-binding protein
MPDDRIPVSLYEQDFDAWAMGQAAALRAVRDAILNGADGPAELLRAIDWENLAEEMEGLARRDRRELASRLALIVEHLAKLEFSSLTEPRAGWITTVRRERGDLADILEDSPSLRREVSNLLARRADKAIQVAAGALESDGEPDAVKACLRRLGTGYTAEEVLGDWIPALAN